MKQPIRMEDIFTTKNILPALGFGVACFFLMLLMLPFNGPGRESVRRAMAFEQARLIESQIINGVRVIDDDGGNVSLSGANGLVVADLDESDPWRSPFVAVVRKGTSPVECYVYSNGLDLISASRGRDADDVSSDMATNPGKNMDAQRRAKLFFALAVPQIVWLSLMLLLIFDRSQKRSP